MLLDLAIQVITSAAVSTAVAALLLWLMRLWISERLKNAIKNEYDQRLETHKAQLKAQSDVEIERLRSQLNIISTEHEVRFSRLHEKRADVIAETYSFLKELYPRVGAYVKIFELAGDPSRQERYEALVKAHGDFQGCYARKLIFFPKITADKLEAIDRELVQAVNEFRLTVDRNDARDRTDKWIEISERVGNEIKTALRELEDEFRRLLGDES